MAAEYPLPQRSQILGKQFIEAILIGSQPLIEEKSHFVINIA